MTDLLSIAEANQQKARRIVEECGVVRAWEAAGADIRLVGSLRMGLLMKRRDIDFHAYTPELTMTRSCQAMEKLAVHPAVSRLECLNTRDPEDECIEWRIDYRDGEGDSWRIDIIHRRRGSHWDGYFERRAQRIAAVLTPETKQTILALKQAAPESEPITGIEYCHAVLQYDVRTWEEFVEWRRQHPLRGILAWCP